MYKKKRKKYFINYYIILAIAFYDYLSTWFHESIAVLLAASSKIWCTYYLIVEFISYHKDNWRKNKEKKKAIKVGKLKSNAIDQMYKKSILCNIVRKKKELCQNKTLIEWVDELNIEYKCMLESWQRWDIFSMNDKFESKTPKKEIIQFEYQSHQHMNFQKKLFFRLRLERKFIKILSTWSAIFLQCYQLSTLQFQNKKFHQ